MALDDKQIPGTTNADEILIEDVSLGALSAVAASGYVVGVGSGGYQTRVDPRDEASGAAAVEAAHDNVAANATRGVVYFPAEDADGDALTWDRTVTFQGASTSRFDGVLPRGVGFATGGALAQCTLDDGSPCIWVRDQLLGAGAWFGEFGFRGAVANNDASGTESAADAAALKITNVQSFTVRGVGTRSMGANGSGAVTPGTIIIGSEVFNGTLTNCSWNMGPVGTSLPDATFLYIDDTEAAGEPGEIVVTECTTYSPPEEPYSHSLRVVTGCTNLKLVDGRFEGAGHDGAAMASIEDSGADLIADGFEFGRLSGDGTPAPHIETTVGGAEVSIDSSVKFGNNSSGGPHVRLHEATTGVVEPFQGNTGVTTDIDLLGTSPNRLVVPYEESMVNDCDYPFDGNPDGGLKDALWNGTVYPDGWQKFRSGSSTVAANDIQNVQNFAGGRVKSGGLEITSSTGDPAVTLAIGRDSGSSTQSVKLIEHNGDSADVDWWLLRKRGT